MSDKGYGIIDSHVRGNFLVSVSTEDGGIIVGRNGINVSVVDTDSM